MQNEEIYYVSENTYKKLYDFCAKRLLAAEIKNSNESYADAGFFTIAKLERDLTDLRELERLFEGENVPTEPLETIAQCPAELSPKVIPETLQKFVVGKGQSVKPGTQFVSHETYFHILADIAETLLYDFLSKPGLQKDRDAEYDFYEWYNKQIDTSSSNISEMIIRDGASPKLLVDLCNRAEDFEDLIIEILDTFRVKPF